MVHAIGNVKMAVMARYLSGGRLSQTIAEESERQKLVSQYVQKQLREADEANLLDEKDMHVFGLKPMTDSLHLVCCNACKKPIKTSQYAAHAELCRSLMPIDDFLSDRNGDAGPKKPPKTERKRSKAAGNKVSPVVTQEHYKKLDPFDAAASKSHFMGHNGSMSSLTVDTTIGGPRHTNLSSTHDNCLTSLNAKDAAATIMPLPKRPKLLAADMVQSSDGLAPERDVCNVSSNKSSLNYVPAPLATKIYYSQRINSLRAELSYMYHQGSTRHCSDETSPKVTEGNFMTCEVTSARILSEEQLFKQTQEKSNMHTLPYPNPNQTIGEHSEVFFDQMGAYHPRIAHDALNSQTPAVEMRRSMYSSKTNPLTTVPGAPLATRKQPDGIVPVV